MTITAARKTSDFTGFISREIAGPIFDDAAKQSVVMRLVPQMPLGASGVSVPATTSRPVANWVAEGAQKEATQGAKGLSNMDPKKLAAICVNSKEVVRANPGGYVSGLREQLAEAFAVAFDYAALYDLGGDGTGTGPFDDAVNDTTNTVEFGTGTTIHNDLTDGLRQLIAAGNRLTGFAFGPSAEPIFLDELDGSNRPLFVDIPLEDATVPIRSGRVIGRPAYIAQTDQVELNDTVGFGGNWNKCRWGVVGGISYTVSTEATVTINGSLVSLFENNLVAILAEAEYGWIMEDTDQFVSFTEQSLLS
jgi:HK97 family phage major capsid protein